MVKRKGLSSLINFIGILVLFLVMRSAAANSVSMLSLIHISEPTRPG